MTFEIDYGKDKFFSFDYSSSRYISKQSADNITYDKIRLFIKANAPDKLNNIKKVVYIFGPEFPREEQEVQQAGPDGTFSYEVLSLRNFSVRARITDQNDQTKEIGPKDVLLDR
jgi:hypothetical protein